MHVFPGLNTVEIHFMTLEDDWFVPGSFQQSCMTAKAAGIKYKFVAMCSHCRPIHLVRIAEKLSKYISYSELRLAD